MSYSMEYTGSSPQRRTKGEYYQFQPQSLGPSLCLVLPRGSQGTESSLRSKRSNVMQKRESRPVLRTADSLDFAQQVTGGLQVTNRNEKELLQELNDRFAGFTEKVHLLENLNIVLEKEIEELREKKTSLSHVYDPEIKDLRQLVYELTLQKRTIEVEHQHLEQDLYILRDKCEAEAHQRSDAEGCIMTLKRDINDADLSKLELDKKAQSLVEEIIFLKKNHQEEVSEMLAQLQEAQVAVEIKDFGKADITAALRDIRKQLEGHTSSNVQQTEECFRAKVAKLTEAAKINKEALQATKQDIQEHRRQLQNKSIELETVKGRKEALESQLNDLEERHDAEINQYQNAIRELDWELKHTKCEMSGHLREYQDLLNVKMALDVEIASYRKLLEGEETRLSSVSGDHISVPYVYRQSPIYSLPRLPKHRSTSAKAEPQYKFVEEIITETTREVEMTEIEETESEVTCVEEPTGAEEESAEEGDTAQITVGPEVSAEEQEDARTAEDEQEETAPDKADTEKRPAPLEEESEDVKEQDTEGKVFPEEETRDTEPLKRLPGEQEKAECAKADMDEETENTPDGVETMKTLEEGSAEEKEECTDTIKAEETKESKELKVGRSLQVSDSESASESHENEGSKETTEVTAGKPPEQRESEFTPERRGKEVSKLGVSSEAKPQEKEAKELERSPEDSPVKEEDKVPKVQSIAAQGDDLEEQTSPEKMTHNLTELKVSQQLQDTESPAMSEVKVSGPPENEEFKAKQIKEAADPGKLKDDSSLETANDEQEMPLNGTAVDIAEPFKNKVASPTTDEKDSGTPSTMESLKPAGYFKPEPTDLPEAETPSVLKPKESQSVITEEAEKKASAPIDVTEDKKADKVTAAEKSTKEPEECQKTEATPLPKEESKSVIIEKVDMGKSTCDEREKVVEPAEEKSAPANDLPDEPTSPDASAVLAKPGLKTVESKVMKEEGLDSREAKDPEKTADTSEGDQIVKGVEATMDLPEKEREEKAVPTSDAKDKEDSPKKMKDDADPKIEENGFYESESIARETTSPEGEEVKVPVIQSQVEPKEKKAELKAS